MIYNLRKAKPVAKDTLLSYGDSTVLPNYPGIYAPYVRALARYDNAMVPCLIRRYFFYLLGSHGEECMDNMAMIQTAWGCIHMTEAGNVLSHIAKCVEIAICCQARSFPIFTNNVYQGSTIQGSGFRVMCNGVVYEPISFPALQKCVVDESIHNHAIVSISRLLRVPLDELTSMRVIQSIYMSKRLDMTAGDLEEIDGLVSRLTFQHMYWSINDDSVIKAMNLIVNPDLPIDTEVPLHPSAFGKVEREYQVLGAFGYNAFSFRLDGGVTVKLSQEVYPHSRLVVRQKLLRTCVEDLIAIRATKLTYNNPQNLGSQFQDRLISKVHMSSVWGVLQQYAATTVITTLNNREVTTTLEDFDF